MVKHPLLIVDQWSMPAHRGRAPAAGGQPRNAKRKADYFASLPSAERAVPDSWEEEVLPGAPDAGNQGMPRTDEVANDTAGDDAVAAGQSAIPSPEEMGSTRPPGGRPHAHCASRRNRSLASWPSRARRRPLRAVTHGPRRPRSPRNTRGNTWRWSVRTCKDRTVLGARKKTPTRFDTFDRPTRQ